MSKRMPSRSAAAVLALCSLAAGSSARVEGLRGGGSAIEEPRRNVRERRRRERARTEADGAGARRRDVDARRTRKEEGGAGRRAAPRTGDGSFAPPAAFDWADEIVMTTTTEPNDYVAAVWTGDVGSTPAIPEPTPKPTPMPVTQRGTIRGTVYHDVNQNGQRDADEPGVAGSVVKLFACSSGARVGITRTDDEGAYAFRIPAAELPASGNSNGGQFTSYSAKMKGCHYVQFNANEYIDPYVPNAKFTTPKNGETYDIYLVQGQNLFNVDAGLYGRTSEPTPDYNGWTTIMPTDLIGAGVVMTEPPRPMPTAMPSPAPYVTMMLAPISNSPTRDTSTGLLPVPTEMAVQSPPVMAPTAMEGAAQGILSSPMTEPAVAAGAAEGSASAPMTAPTVPFPLPTVPSPMSAPTPITEPTPIPPSPAGMVLWSTESPVGAAVTWSFAEDPSGKPDKTSKPDKEGKAEKIPEKGKSEQDEEELVITKSVTQSSETTLRLNATVGVVLDNVRIPMDPGARSLFENVCAEFLDDQLQYATPPIYDHECTVADQSLVEGRRRRLRSLAASGLAADVEVKGTVNKKRSIQQPADVKFKELLLGTFNVQGYLFLKALKGAEEEDNNTTSTYYSSIDGIRGMDANGAESTKAGDGGESDTIFTKGIIAAVAVGGVTFLGLLLLVCKKCCRRKSKSGARSDAATGSAKSSKANSNVTTASKRKAKVSKKNSRPLPAIEASDTADTSSPTNAASGGAARNPSSTSGAADASKKRARREILAPPGKLGLMVANTKSAGHGPVVHTVRPGSPLEGKVRVNDTIVAVNDVDTRSFTAEEMTRLMRETAREERRIVVLRGSRR